MPPGSSFGNGFIFVGIAAVVVGENTVTVRSLYRTDSKIIICGHGDPPAVSKEFVRALPPVGVKGFDLRKGIGRLQDKS